MASSLAPLSLSTRLFIAQVTHIASITFGFQPTMLSNSLPISNLLRPWPLDKILFVFYTANNNDGLCYYCYYWYLSYWLKDLTFDIAFLVLILASFCISNSEIWSYWMVFWSSGIISYCIHLTHRTFPPNAGFSLSQHLVHAHQCLVASVDTVMETRTSHC